MRPRGVGVAALWSGAWAAWLLTGALVPVPPWSAPQTLDAESRAAAALLADAERTPAWSATAGGPQRGAFGAGWAEPQRDAGSAFRRAVLPSAEVVFQAPRLAAASLRMRIGPAASPVSVAVALDGRPRGTLDFAAGWSEASLELGALDAGRHALVLRGPDDWTLAFVAVGRLARGMPERDGGFVQWRAIGADERPVYYPTAGAEPPPGLPRLERAGLVGAYGFAAGAGGPVATALEVLHGLVAAGLLAFVTGLPFACRLPGPGAARFAGALALSALAIVTVFVALRLLGLAPGALPVAAGLAGLGALGLARAGRARVAVPWRALGPALLAAPILAVFALRVVPPLVDQDVELQGTAHAIATRQQPRMVTDRATTWFFAHPPLLHVFTAGGFALSGRLGRVADAHTLALEGASREPFVAPAPGSYPPRYYDLWWRLLERFHREPQLWPTRAVNVLLAAAALAWLAELAARVSGSTAAGLAIAAVLASQPEFLVRGSYGGYFALTALSGLALLFALLAGDRAGAGLGAALGALADQKGLLVPAAFVLAAPRGTGLWRVAPALAAAGALSAFAVWGLALDAPSFLHDFLREHVARRLALGDVRFDHDASAWYPSIPELWLEFAARYGVLFTLASGAASLLALRSRAPAVRAAGAAALLGALVFSVTDWRQTKHLSLLAAPALVAVAALWPPGRRARLVFLAALLAMIAGNLLRDAALVADFDSLRPSTIW
jgi:hypothetical protein